jgi:DNA (cytosine-5)-methyltransferase 1
MLMETVIELCAGAGGLACGIGEAGFRHQLAVDFDVDCCRTLSQNWKWKILQSDLRALNYRIFKQEPDLLAGGPPCQPFSVAGQHAADSDPRDMFPQVVRAVRELKPKAFLFENVAGLMRPRFAEYVEYISLQLCEPELPIKGKEKWFEHSLRLRRASLKINNSNRLRYSVSRQVLNAADFGVPQNRLRVFFVGFREEFGARWSFPLATHSEAALLHSKWITGEYWKKNDIPTSAITQKEATRIKLLEHQPELLLRFPWKTVRDAIGDLPDPENQKIGARKVENHDFVPGAKSYPPGHTGSAHDLPSKALKAGVNGVGGGENMLLKSNGDVRYFTSLEMRRIQTFRDSYQFIGNRSSITKQLGNAVPPTLAKHVAESIRQTLQRLKKGNSVL